MADDSILDTTKKVLGIDADYTVFDTDIIMHINSVFSTLQQLAVGPNIGFSIEDKSAKWSDFIGSQQNINNVKTYVYLRVRLLFDPPATSFAIDAFQSQAKELEWRLNVAVDPTQTYISVPETPTVDPDPTEVRKLTLSAASLFVTEADNPDPTHFTVETNWDNELTPFLAYSNSPGMWGSFLPLTVTENPRIFEVELAFGMVEGEKVSFRVEVDGVISNIITLTGTTRID